MNVSTNRISSDRDIELSLEKELDMTLSNSSEITRETRPVADQFTAPKPPHLRPVSAAQPAAPTMDSKLSDTLSSIVNKTKQEAPKEATKIASTTKEVTASDTHAPARYLKGEYAGMTKEEAVSKELETQSAMPSERLKRMRDQSAHNVEVMEATKRKFIAEKKVQTTSIDAEFEDRSNHLRSEIEELKASIKKLQDDIEDNEQERRARLAETTSKYDVEIGSLTAMINASNIMISNLAGEFKSTQVEHSEA